MENAMRLRVLAAAAVLVSAAVHLKLWLDGFRDISVIGPAFLLGLAPAILAVVIAPFLMVRAYALRGAVYILEREGIRLHWGLRLEDIPINEVQWIRPAQEVRPGLPLPLVRWPGAVLGIRHLTDGKEIEYLASSTHGMLVIATPQRLFAISPSDPTGFLYTYHRLEELGSLSPIESRSVYPTFLLGQVWAKKAARWLVLAGLALSVILLVWVSLAIPGRAEVHLGFRPDGSPGDLVPAARLLLLALLNSIIFLIDFLLGLFYFRRDEDHPLAYLLWSSGAVTSLLFLLGLFFTLLSQ
jgi:hypothetical protein